MELNPGELVLLANQSNETLAEWYTMLHHWEWPSELFSSSCSGPRRTLLMRWLENILGSETCNIKGAK